MGAGGRPVRVAMLGQYPENPQRMYGGVEAVVAALAGELARRPEVELHIVRCITRVRQHTIEQREGLTIHWLPRPRFGRLTFHRRDVALLLRCLAEIQPDIVHAHGTGLYAGAAIASRRHAVVTAHGIIHREAHMAVNVKDWIGWQFNILYERRVLRHAPNIIAISPYVVQEFAGLLRGNVYLVENPVAEDFFKIFTRGKPGRILFAGLVIARKDPLTAIRAFALARQKHPEARLRIAGALDAEPAYAAGAQELAARLGVADAVDFLGHLDEAAILAEYRASSIFLLSSVQETAPVVVEQALAAGRPCVVTDAGGAAYLVEEGQTGFVVPIGDAAGLARALNRLIEEPALYNEMMATARRMAEVRFRAASVAAQTLTVYEDVLTRGPAAPGRMILR
jgi:glycosyltransferase involved in cell wall biosynthesis